jgi:hypothetical protein
MAEGSGVPTCAILGWPSRRWQGHGGEATGGACLERVLYMSSDRRAWGDVRYHLANDNKVGEGVVDGCC